MITFKKTDMDYSGSKDRIEGECLSTDTKPTKYANGSALIEMDTGDRFMFDEEGGAWIKLGSGGGGDAEVWLTGTITEMEGSKAAILTPTEIADISGLVAHPSNYDVTMNGLSLPEVYDQREGGAIIIMWADSLTTPTAYVQYTKPDEGEETWFALAPSDWEIGVSVEVSVKAK